MSDLSSPAAVSANANGALLSVVVPCFNEAEVIRETVVRLRKVADALPGVRVEMIFVDDGSRDGTNDLLTAFVEEDARIKVIVFARNFGHQVAVSAGIDAANGDAVVLIDADLQDPPELIADMLVRWREGFDVVYGRRVERAGETRLKRWTARWFYRLLRGISDVPIPLDTGDFRLMSRAVVNVLRAMPENDRFVRGMVSWVGYRQVELPYARQERFAGETKYPLRRMVRFALDGILSFSSKPLQMSIALGMFAASIAMLGILYALAARIFTNVWVEGWTALMLAVLFMGGVQLVCLGILGEYVGRIYKEVKQRPLYVVREVLNREANWSPHFTRSPNGLAPKSSSP